MAMILHIETATSVCSVALSRDNQLLGGKESHEGLVHGELLAVYIRDLLQQTGIQPAELHAISVSMGPGSYTGLRVGLSTAKGMALGLGIPILALPTLEILARTSFEQDRNAWHLAAIDARRNEVYALLINPQGRISRGPEPLILDEEDFKGWFPENAVSIVVCGDGAPKVVRQWSESGIRDNQLRCSAQHMIPMALKAWEACEYADLVYAEPFYLKPPNITIPTLKPLL